MERERQPELLPGNLELNSQLVALGKERTRSYREQYMSYGVKEEESYYINSLSPQEYFYKDYTMGSLNYQENEIETKSEMLGRAIGRLVVNSFIQPPQNQQNLPAWQKGIIAPLPSKILNGGKIQRPLSSFQKMGATEPEDLPEMALPILEFMEDIQPHIVIGCDRGGRLFGLAMHAAWQQTRHSKPFPTLDGKMHFARISKSEDVDVLQEKVDGIVKASRLFGKQRGNNLAEDEQLRVLFIDDWVIGGGTKLLAQRLMEKHGAQTHFAVMCGEGADATGKQDLHTRVSWHDRPEEIGVNYLSTFTQEADGSIVQKQEVVAVRGNEAVSNRQRIQKAARQLPPIQVAQTIASVA